MDSPGEPLKVLLVEDDEDDYFLAKELFSEFNGWHVQLDWMKNFASGLEAITRSAHDVCLVDYRLGAQNGIELLRTALERGCKAPIILLTGQGEHQIDLEAMRAGASDYLVKGRLDSGLLERSIRYALERKRAASRAASEQARLAAFGEEVGLALTRRDELDTILHRCTNAMVHYLHAALARIWIYENEEKSLKLHASAGSIEEPGPLQGKAPKIMLDMGLASKGNRS
jgi:DNA-binding NtrC family response regulator